MKKLILTILLLASISPVNTFAVDTYTLLEPLPCVEGVGGCKVGELQKEINFADYVGYVYKFSIALAVFLAIVVIIYAGFEYMLSEALPAKLDAKGRIKSAVTGLLLVFSSYLILRVIDPRLVQVYTEVPPVDFKVDQETVDFLLSASDGTMYNPEIGAIEVSAETKSKLQAASEEISSLKSKASELEKKKSSGGTLTAEETKELATLNQNIKSVSATAIKIRTDDELNSIFFKTVNSTTATPETYSNSGTNINLITTNRSKSLQELKDYTSVQKLANQNDFYNAQLKEQQELNEKLKSGSDTAYLKNKMTQYQTKLTSISTGSDKSITSIGVDAEKYKQLLTDRMNKINDVLVKAANKK